MSTKDLFSTQSKVYAAFRPTYPKDLYDFIFKHLRETHTAWDCATGNGQVAQPLSMHFEKVIATDISQQQLDSATHADNIVYSLSPAEKTAFADHQFDLITVAQALHWFDQKAFYAEAARTGKPGSLIAVWGYALLKITPAIDGIVRDFYTVTVGPYWDEARKLVEQEYATIAFPFEQITSPQFSIDAQWSLDHLHGYLETWSATQKFIRQHGYNPVPEVIERIKAHWVRDEITPISFPIFLKLGRLPG